MLATCVLLFASSTHFSQTLPATKERQITRPIQMLVLGDSILWGQGLKTDKKPSHYVKIWLEKSTGRRVEERIEAHSGAVIEGSTITDKRTSANREVNLALPAIHSDTSQVDLVLVSGCGNDVGAQNLLNASNTDEVDDMTKAKCSGPIENLLLRITRAFPQAHVILTGYYRFFSDETRNDFVAKAMSRRFFKSQRQGAPQMSSREVFERLKQNSKQWYEASNSTLSEAVTRVNSKLDQHRVTFAKIEFPAAYSFAAKETHLWGFDRSFFRMALLFLSFGKALLPSNDDMRGQRSAGCNEVYREFTNETAQQKKERKALRLFCRYAALGHPNRKGALLYANAITTALKSTPLTTASAHP